MKKLLFLIFGLMPIFLFGTALQETLHNAKSGDYVVFQAGHRITYLTITSIQNELLSLMEISVADTQKPTNWQLWVEQGAPQHNSWTRSTIDLAEGKLKTFEILLDGNWVQTEPQVVLLPTIIAIQLSPVPVEEQKKIGSAPENDMDTRKLWRPRIIVEEKELINRSCQVMQGIYPDDGSDLANKRIFFYFPVDPHSLTYFPYWIEIPGLWKAKLTVIDSGRQEPL